MTRSDKPRKQTPRIPSNVLYDRIVPIAIGLLVLVLLAVLLGVMLGIRIGY
jgi:hypothetical protein